VPEFEKRNVKVIGISNDPVEEHKAWIKDIEAFSVQSL
jgi:1-Cys peroxiredoxin 6